MHFPRHKRCIFIVSFELKMKYVPLILILSLVLILQAMSALSEQREGKIRVGIFQNKPLSFIDEQGVAQGIYPDIIREIGKIENWEPEFVLDTWSGCLARLE